MVFEQVTKTKKLVTTTLLTSYPALQNAYYNEEIHSEVGKNTYIKQIIKSPLSISRIFYKINNM